MCLAGEVGRYQRTNCARRGLVSLCGRRDGLAAFEVADQRAGLTACVGQTEPGAIATQSDIADLIGHTLAQNERLGAGRADPHAQARDIAVAVLHLPLFGSLQA